MLEAFVFGAVHIPRAVIPQQMVHPIPRKMIVAVVIRMFLQALFQKLGPVDQQIKLISVISTFQCQYLLQKGITIHFFKGKKPNIEFLDIRKEIV